MEEVRRRRMRRRKKMVRMMVISINLNWLLLVFVAI